jgi:hypothetical protein
MAAPKRMGSDKVKREYTLEHCKRLEKWFDKNGEFVHFGTPPSSRERFWNCCSLLAHGGKKYRDLALNIILKTPVDKNHFEPIAAVELMLNWKDKLTPGAYKHLETIVRAHYVNMLEVRMASCAVHNFTCMTTWFLLAAAQVLEDGIEWEHPLGSIPEVYTRDRLKAIGLNALHALAHVDEQDPVIHEWNSPTYTPISLMALAKIVEFIDDEEARELALGIEQSIWRQELALIHPRLGQVCGPYARAYRVDVLGQNSQMRVLLAYLGLSKDKSIVNLFDESREGLIFHHDGDVPFTWSGPAWRMSTRYHLPADALREYRKRTFPSTFTAPIHWDAFGYLDKKKKKYVSLQGGLLPGGEAEMVQTQFPSACIGYRTRAKLGHSFPLCWHYALAKNVRTMRDVRNVLVGVLFRQAPTEWVKNQAGGRMEARNFNNEGSVEVSGKGTALSFSAAPYEELAPLPTDEISLNSFIPLHFADVDSVTLSGTEYAGAPVSVRGKSATLRVRDGEAEYEIAYEFPKQVEIRLYRWANFLRFAGFLYEGKKKTFTPAALRKLTGRGQFRVIRTPGGKRG